MHVRVFPENQNCAWTSSCSCEDFPRWRVSVSAWSPWECRLPLSSSSQASLCSLKKQYLFSVCLLSKKSPLVCWSLLVPKKSILSSSPSKKNQKSLFCFWKKSSLLLWISPPPENNISPLYMEYSISIFFFSNTRGWPPFLYGSLTLHISFPFRRCTWYRKVHTCGSHWRFPRMQPAFHLVSKSDPQRPQSGKFLQIPCCYSASLLVYNEGFLSGFAQLNLRPTILKLVDDRDV